jgi:cytochrome c peroxidase
MITLAGLLFAMAWATTHQNPAMRAAQPAPASWTAEPIQPLLRAPSLQSAKVALGKRLFEDARLSGEQKVSCATCHDVATNGSRKDKRMTSMDTLTVFNSALSSRLGWDGSELTLQQQARATLETPMVSQGVSLQTRVGRLAGDETIMREFQRVYGRPVSQDKVIDAIVHYERSLVTPGSRFDLWLAGDASAINEQEARGYRLFKQLGCVSCHQGRNVGGNLMQKHGIFRPLAKPDPKVLRVPSLRNVAVTGPYFHDGSASTLDRAVVKMAASQLNVDIDRRETADLVAFLKTLTGNYGGRPVRAPR